MTYMIGFHLFVKMVLEVLTFDDVIADIKELFYLCEVFAKQEDKGFHTYIDDKGYVYEFFWYKDKERRIGLKNDLGHFKISFKRNNCYSDTFQRYLLVRTAGHAAELGADEYFRETIKDE